MVQQKAFVLLFLSFFFTIFFSVFVQAEKGFVLLLFSTLTLNTFYVFFSVFFLGKEIPDFLESSVDIIGLSFTFLFLLIFNLLNISGFISFVLTLCFIASVYMIASSAFILLDELFSSREKDFI